MGTSSPSAAAALLALFCMGACAPATPSTQVERDWTDAMRRFSIVGLYPITEDLQPGDILLDLPAERGADPQPRLQRLGSVDPGLLRQALREQEQGRLRFEMLKPDAPASSNDAKPAEGSSVTTTVTAAAGEAVATSTTVRPGQGQARAQSGAQARPRGAASPRGSATASKAPDPDVAAPAEVLGADTAQRRDAVLPRMRRVALPGVTAARVFDWQIGGAGPIGQVAVALGLAGNGAAALLIHLKGLELVGFDSLAALRLEDDNLVTWLQGTGTHPSDYSAARVLSLVGRSNPSALRRICRNESVPSGDERSIIRLVNRVLYAHDIEYEYTRSSEFAGRLAADIAQSAAAARTLVPSGGKESAALPATTSASASAAADAEAARAQALLTALAANSPSTPGVRATLGVGTYGNAALKEHYMQPMAVGFVSTSTFTVRSSLVLTGRSAGASRTQLLAAREACAPFLSDGELMAAGQDGRAIPALSPVEQLVCSNTRSVLRRGDRASIALPPECGGPLPSVQAGIERLPAGAFEQAGPQRRDARARSLAM